MGGFRAAQGRLCVVVASVASLLWSEWEQLSLLHSVQAGQLCPLRPAGLQQVEKRRAGRQPQQVQAAIFGVGAPEAILVGVVALLVFGPKGLAQVWVGTAAAVLTNLLLELPTAMLPVRAGEPVKTSGCSSVVAAERCR